MITVIVPVLLSVLLGPGVGQLYNKEFKKGGRLILVSLGLLFTFSVWLSRAAMGYLPTDLNTVDRNVLRDIIQIHIVKDHTLTFYTYEALLGAVWVYGVVDAYLGGMRRRASPPTIPSKEA